MAASALISLMAFTLAAGCGGPLSAEAMSLEQATSAIEPGDCPTGNCGDPTSNGKGLFIDEHSSYCIPFSPARFFCPEVFTNIPGGGVELIGPDTGSVETKRILMMGHWKGIPVQVVSISADSLGVVVTVNTGYKVRQLTGAALADLVLTSTQGEIPLTLRINFSHSENSVGLYQVEYSLDSSISWQSYCADGTGTAAFLPLRSVHNVTGKMTASPSAVTMACRTGAIATCIVWGYKPWEAAPGNEARADFLYGSCLQAKRAAYFVKYGDFNSYTVPGTPLALQDKDSVMNALMPGAEALWSPNGAACLSPQFRRIPPPGSRPMPTLPAAIPVPACDQETHDAAKLGILPALLQETAPLATGPVL
jgi:hypothetical protein